VNWATLNAARNTAWRPDSATMIVVIARSSTATGSPQNSRAAKQKVRAAFPASEAAWAGVTIGLSSPTRVSAAMTQNKGWPASPTSPGPDSPPMAAASAPRPATVTTAR